MMMIVVNVLKFGTQVYIDKLHQCVEFHSNRSFAEKLLKFTKNVPNL